MSRHHIVYAFALLILSGCSSSGGRAPVSELSINKQKTVDNRRNKSELRNRAYYVVQKGDTLYGIAWQANLDVTALAKLNNLGSPYTIHPGDKLKLLASAPSSAKYVVKSGDTLSGIASKTKVSLATLAKLNHLQSPYKIHPGDTLNLLSPAEKNKKSKVKTTAKTGATPQKITKASCATQKCKENDKEKLVQRKTKEYPNHKVDSKTSKKNIKSKVNHKVDGWRWPAKGRLVKTFTLSRAGMKGISLTNQRGTAIYASAPGIVVYAGSALRGYGNLIIIKHNNNYLSAYAHNEKLLVKENEKISNGQKIATMGDSGTDNVHLHFEIRYKGKAVDPERYLPKR